MDQQYQIDANRVIGKLQEEIAKKSLELATMQALVEQLQEENVRLLEAAHG